MSKTRGVRPILARRVFMVKGSAHMARDTWKRDGLTLGVKPRSVRVYERVVRCDGIRHPLWMVVAYGAPLKEGGEEIPT